MTDEHMGNPTPIGLMGLAIGCAALAPAEFGLTAMTDPMVWVWMLLTAGALQVYAGIVDLVNRNVLGATAFTVYGVLWLISAWQIGHAVELGETATEVKGFVFLVYLAFTLFMTIGFATVSRTLTIVFVAFIVIFAVEVAAAFVPALHGSAIFVAGVLHTLAAVLCIWAAAGGVVNPILGRNLFEQGAPLLRSHGAMPEADDFESLARHAALRKQLVTALYGFWETHAWDWVSARRVADELRLAVDAIAPDFWYLFQRGFVEVDEQHMRQHPDEPKMVRLTAAGIDYYRELQMGKFKF